MVLNDDNTLVSLEEMPSESHIMTLYQLFHHFFQKRSLLLLLWTFMSLYRMPTNQRLPDLLGDAVPYYGNLRASAAYMKHQPADILSVTLTVGASLSLIYWWPWGNVRKLGVVYCLSINLRTLFFTVTGLPPPCINYPKCPCATIPYQQAAGNLSAPAIAFFYTFAMGLFLGNMPQCGDLTMSGHTIYLWVLALFILDILNVAFQNNPCILIMIKIAIYLLLFLVCAAIVLIRNHYTIDVVLAIVFVNILWQIYSWLQNLVRDGTEEFKSSIYSKIMLWLEYDIDSNLNSSSDSSSGNAVEVDIDFTPSRLSFHPPRSLL